MSESLGQGILSFVLAPDQREDRLTGQAGLPLVDEVLLALGIDHAVREHLKIKDRERGFSEEQMVASLIVAIAAGADCLDDLQILREDQALARMREMQMPSPSAAREFLYEFHDEKLIEKAKQERPPGTESYVPGESEALQGLGRVNAELIRAVIAARGGTRKATLDQDGTIIEAHKKEALPHYKGGRGYQPTLVYSPEFDLVLHDEFRDGNVPAGSGNLLIAQRAFAVLPSEIGDLYFRGDSACYEQSLLKWLSDTNRKEGPKGRIGFTISADMTESLRALCQKVPCGTWAMLDNERDEETVEWAEVEFTPGDWPKQAEPLRYLALRIRKRQEPLFAEGAENKYLAVVTNREGQGDQLIRWHWEKAGTIEKVHDVLKNDLAAGVMPCGRFGANAAWLRLNVLTFNTLSALKQLALPPELEDARPKRLRYRLFGISGRLAQHQRRLEVRLGAAEERAEGIIQVRRELLRLYRRQASSTRGFSGPSE